MTKPSLRVYFVEYEDGRRTGTLMRTWDAFFDRPAPSAYGATTEDVLAELETKLEQMRLEGSDGLERYLWEERFDTATVRVAIHPLSSVKKRPVIGKKEIPLLLTYAHCPLKGGGFRVMVPRFGAWFVVEELALAPELLRHAVTGWLLGENPRWVYDLRHVGREYVSEWSPALLAKARAAPPEDREPVPPELARVADDLTDRAARGKLPVVVGDSQLQRDLEALSARPRPPSLLFVGATGVGKTTLVRRLALHHAAQRRGKDKKLPRIFSTSRDRVIAGMVYLGMWQERCIALVKELEEDGDALHVDTLSGLLAVQPDGAAIADFLEPAMAEGDVRVLAECTEEELERARRQRPGFVARFEVVRVEEPSPERTIELLSFYAKRKPGLEIHAAALRRLVRHLAMLERSVAFPGKGFRFIDWLVQQGSGAARGSTPTSATPRTLYPRDMSEAYSRYSGVPVALLSDDISASAEDLAAGLRARVVGQDAACEACGRLLARFKANLVDPERPCGTLLFVGPTGVGKTELAKQLARTTFGGEERLIRLDMSEYRLPGSARRLLEVGAGVRSLASLVRQTPLSLVLLDEIEKAHAEVFDLLLGVLGEGRMTDASGRFVDFRTAIIIMTSNVGVSETRPVGFGGGDEGAAASDLARQVRAHFRPEFFNRIDHVLSFRALSLGDVERVVDLELEQARLRPGFVRRGLRLSVTAAARARLAERGYHPTRGARPLRRLLEEAVMTPIATKIAEDRAFRERLVVVATDACAVPGGAFPVRI